MSGQPCRKKVLLGCLIAHAVPWIFFVIFFGLYVALRKSDPAVKWTECQAELQNQSSETRARTASLRQCVEAMEKEQEESKAQGNRLQAQLADANRSTAELQGHWHTCQEQLKILQDNITSKEVEVSQHEAEKRKAIEEQVKQLKEQLRSQSDELKDQREKYQTLEAELKKQHSETSGWSTRGDHSAVLLPLVFGGLSSLFFL